MRKLLSILTLSIVLLSCKKDSSDSNNGGSSTYYLKCKIDGTSREFKYYPMAKILDYGNLGGLQLSLTANESENPTTLVGLNLSIIFMKGRPEVKTYKESDATFDYTVGGVYNPGSMTVVYGAGLNTSLTSPLSITFTSITDKEMTGTFHGAFYENNNTTGDISSTKHVKITEGQFKLPIK
ncbi:MAG TPA: hypothetical protein VD794_01760 [Flavisolibacter sp.]|nr:hypothetical protein [Flavisolibacter sp.]